MLPLEGIRVLDFGSGVFGAMTGRLLGDMGADVIKVEPLEGDYNRLAALGGDSFFFLIANANKRSLSLNLKDSRGNEILHKLIKDADVLSQNFRPGVLQKFELDYESVSKVNPRLVYCSLSLYGESGPLAKRGGGDIHAQAFTGTVAAQGTPGGPPYLSGAAYCDYTGAALASLAIVSALLMRDRTGKGQEVTTSLVNAGIYMQDMPIGYFINTGTLLKKTGRGDIVGRFPWGPYTAKDGDLVVTYGQGDDEWPVLCSMLGIEHLIDDRRYDAEHKRIERRFELYPVLDEAFGKMTRTEWDNIFREHGQRCYPCQDYSELVAHPQFLANDLVAEFDHPREGKLKLIGHPNKLKGCTPHQALRPPPVMAEHTKEILLELGYTEEQIEQYDKEGVVRVATPDLFERKEMPPLTSIYPTRHHPAFGKRGQPR